jgi:hypothetical protein
MSDDHRESFPGTLRELDEAIKAEYLRLYEARGDSARESSAMKLQTLTGEKLYQALTLGTIAINTSSRQFAESFTNLQTTFEREIKAFSAASDKTTRAMVIWTRVLAVATIGLVIATGVLAWVEYAARGAPHS